MGRKESFVRILRSSRVDHRLHLFLVITSLGICHQMFRKTAEPANDVESAFHSVKPTDPTGMVTTLPSTKSFSPRGAIGRVLSHWTVQTLFTLTIIVNVLVLSIDYYEAPPEIDTVMSITNTVCLAIFVVEIALKWFAFGIVAYFWVPFNILDFCLVLLSCVEFAIQQSASLSALRSLRGLKVMRLMLLGRLAHRIKALSLLLGVFAQSKSM